jgi:hypothetical protein
VVAGVILREDSSREGDRGVVRAGIAVVDEH